MGWCEERGLGGWEVFGGVGRYGGKTEGFAPPIPQPPQREERPIQYQKSYTQKSRQTADNQDFFGRIIDK